MLKSIKNLYFTLTLAGSLPFIIGAILLYWGVTHVAGFGSVIDAVVIYGLMIAAFMAGTHWAQYLKGHNKIAINLLITSNIMTVALWLLYLLTPNYVVLAALIIDFALLLFLDFLICKAGIITKTYLLLRILITIIVIVTLVLILMLYMGRS